MATTRAAGVRDGRPRHSWASVFGFLDRVAIRIVLAVTIALVGCDAVPPLPRVKDPQREPGVELQVTRPAVRADVDRTDLRAIVYPPLTEAKLDSLVRPEPDQVKYVWQIVEGGGVILGGAGATVHYRPARVAVQRQEVWVRCTVVRLGPAWRR